MSGISGEGGVPGCDNARQTREATDNDHDVQERPFMFENNDEDEVETDIPEEYVRRPKRQKITVGESSSDEENSEEFEAELKLELTQANDRASEGEDLEYEDDDSFEVVGENSAASVDGEHDHSKHSTSVIQLDDRSFRAGVDARYTPDANSDSDAEARLQQVVEISDEEPADELQEKIVRPSEHKRASDYKCPICFDPPEAALVTPCGHVFCTECLFQMVNSSRGYRRAGHCALCRKEVKFKDVRMIIMRKKRVLKNS
ncbi:LAFE_0B09296g1_1 [Lachancea fermentati]|uniref:LAFE_0B09296g1_1 n=1 Tax=Lachancea fermentati TaxID=4955 RepID=A0A1G4M8C0_LACFM|nr:LAFE_0B09296g1_1 [Lachancea fermentati]